jgi:hypothetical protein
VLLGAVAHMRGPAVTGITGGTTAYGGPGTVKILWALSFDMNDKCNSKL